MAEMTSRHHWVINNTDSW